MAGCSIFDNEAHALHKEGLTHQECIEADDRLARFGEVELNLDAEHRSQIFLGAFKIVDNEAYYVRSDGTLGQSWTDLYQPPKVHSGYKPMPGEYVAQAMQALDLLVNGGAQRVFLFSPAIRADGVVLHPDTDRSYAYEFVVMQNKRGEREILCLTKEGHPNAAIFAKELPHLPDPQIEIRRLPPAETKPPADPKPSTDPKPDLNQTGFGLLVQFGEPITTRTFTSRLDGGTVTAGQTRLTYEGGSRFIDPFTYHLGEAGSSKGSTHSLGTASAQTISDHTVTAPLHLTEKTHLRGVESARAPAILGEDIAHPHQVARGAFMDSNYALGYSSEVFRPSSVLLPRSAATAAAVPPSTYDRKADEVGGTVGRYPTQPVQLVFGPPASRGNSTAPVPPYVPSDRSTSRSTGAMSSIDVDKGVGSYRRRDFTAATPTTSASTRQLESERQTAALGGVNARLPASAAVAPVSSSVPPGEDRRYLRSHERANNARSPSEIRYRSPVPRKHSGEGATYAMPTHKADHTITEGRIRPSRGLHSDIDSSNQPPQGNYRDRSNLSRSTNHNRPTFTRRAENSGDTSSATSTTSGRSLLNRSGVPRPEALRLHTSSEHLGRAGESAKGRPSMYHTMKRALLGQQITKVRHGKNGIAQRNAVKLRPIRPNIIKANGRLKETSPRHRIGRQKFEPSARQKRNDLPHASSKTTPTSRSHLKVASMRKISSRFKSLAKNITRGVATSRSKKRDTTLFRSNHVRKISAYAPKSRKGHPPGRATQPLTTVPSVRHKLLRKYGESTVSTVLRMRLGEHPQLSAQRRMMIRGALRRVCLNVARDFGGPRPLLMRLLRSFPISELLRLEYLFSARRLAKKRGYSGKPSLAEDISSISWREIQELLDCAEVQSEEVASDTLSSVSPAQSSKVTPSGYIAEDVTPIKFLRTVRTLEISSNDESGNKDSTHKPRTNQVWYSGH